jgi:hypothetical protein
MDNTAEPYDLVTVLMNLQALEGMGGEIGRGHPVDDELGVPATEVGRTGLVRKMLTALLSLRWCCMDRLRICVDKLRVFAKEFDNPNSVLLIQKRINEFLHGEVPGGRAPIERLTEAIEMEEAKKRQGEDWDIARKYVRSLLQRLSKA